MEKLRQFWSRVFPLGFLSDFKELLYSAMPLIFIAVVQISLQITSIFFAGQLGTAQLDGVSLANSIINIVVFVSIEGLGTACDTLFPQLFGGTDRKKIGIVLQKAILISIFNMLISASLLLNASNLLVVISKEKEVVVYANDFLIYFLPSIISFNLISILGRYVQSQSIIYPLMAINVVIVIVNIGFHWLFIFGFDWGVKGAAIAINISTLVGVILTLILIFVKKIYIDTWTPWSIECLYDWKMYLKLAIPGLIAILIEWSNVEVGSLAAAALDEIELAVMSIGQQVMFIAFQVPYAIAIAANIRVGQFLGANKPDEALNAAKVTYALTAACSNTLVIDIVSLFCIIYFGAPIIPGIFDSDIEVISRTIPFLQLIAVVHIVDALQGTTSGIIRAVGGQFYASIISVIGYYIIGSPLGLCLMFLTDTKIFGFMYGNIVGFIIINILQFIYVGRLNWVKVAEKAHNLSIEEAKSIPNAFSNPNFANFDEDAKSVVDDDTKSVKSLVEEDAKSVKSGEAIEMEIISAEEDKYKTKKPKTKKKLSTALKAQLRKRVVFYLVAFLIFFISIFTHNLTDFDSLIAVTAELFNSTTSTMTTSTTLNNLFFAVL